MSNQYFSFKQFTIFQDRCAMKVTTDSCLFGAWCATQVSLKTTSGSLLDIGTGTGLLSLMIAQKNSVHIDAVEIDESAAGQAAENIETASFNCSIKVTCSDIASFENKNYETIVCNPPFYEGDLQGPADRKNVAHHSSHLKWPDLFRIISQKLHIDGNFFLLLPFKRADEAAHLLASAGLSIHSSVLLRPTPGHQPFRVMIRGSKKEGEKTVRALSIKNSEGTYTEAFTALLQDYYLYL